MRYLGQLLILCLLLISCGGSTTESKQEVSSNKSDRIEVLDFHLTHRCVTCNAIEANTKYTLETYFSSQMEDQVITFDVINIDKDVNSKMVNKFKASGTSLKLNIIKGGKETQVDLTSFAFMYGKDKDRFSEQLKVKLDSYLKDL